MVTETRPAPTGFWYDNLRILTIMGVIGGLLIGTLLALTVGPHPPRLGEESAGDEALVSDVRTALGSDRGLKTLSVGRIRDDQVVFAGLGTEDGEVPTPQTPYELGSITKTFTGMLLADAVQRGEMAVEDRLAQHLPELAGTPAGDVSLYELATHSSGLPALAPTGSDTLLAVLSNRNPYDISVEELIAATRTVELTDPGRYAYSNLGMSLLGHAEARAAGAENWADLARQRLLSPLGMTATTFALTEDEIPTGGVRGHRENGWRAAYWYGAAYLPAGSSTWSTAEDMMTFAQAVLAGRAPGMAALEPEGEATTGEIGLAWHTSEVERREITWHNGDTGGMHTMLALDRERGQAVIVLSNTSQSIDEAGLHLAAAAGTPVAADGPGAAQHSHPGRHGRRVGFPGRLRPGGVARPGPAHGGERVAVRCHGAADPAGLRAVGLGTRPGSGEPSPERRRRWPRTRCCGPGRCRGSRYAGARWAGSVSVRA